MAETLITTDAGSDIGSPAVVACVQRVFCSTVFPPPERGIVSVV